MAARKRAAPPAAEEHVGTVEHYYPKVQAAAVRLDADLKVGDTIHVQGATDDVIGAVRSLQRDHQPVQEAHAGESVGVGMPVKVHEHSEVRKVVAPQAPPRAAGAKPARRAAAKADVRRRGTVRTRKSAGSPRKRSRKATVARAAARRRSVKPAARPRKGKAARSKRAAKATARRSTARRAKRAAPARKAAKRRRR